MKTSYVIRLLKVLMVTTLLSSNTLFCRDKYSYQLDTIFEVFTSRDFQFLTQDDMLHTCKEKCIDITTAVKDISLFPASQSYTVVENKTIGNKEKVTVENLCADKLALHYLLFNPKGELIRLDLNHPNFSKSLPLNELLTTKIR